MRWGTPAFALRLIARQPGRRSELDGVSPGVVPSQSDRMQQPPTPPAPTPPPSPSCPPGWYADPWGIAPWRYFDGSTWSGYVLHQQTPGPPPLGNSGRAQTRGQGIRGGLIALAGGLTGVGLSLAFQAIFIAVAHVPLSQLRHHLFILVVSEAGLWVGFLGAALLASHRHGSGSWRKDFGLEPPSPPQCIAAVGWGFLARIAGVVVGVVIAIIVVAVKGGHSVHRARARPSIIGYTPHGMPDWFVLGLMVCVLAPIVEEIFFRGLVQGAAIRTWGPTVGVIVTAVIFSCGHILDEGLTAPFILFPGAILLGELRRRTGKLGPGIVAHATMNTISFVTVLLLSTVH